MIEITKWEYMDLNSYIRSKHDYNAFLIRIPKVMIRNQKPKY